MPDLTITRSGVAAIAAGSANILPTVTATGVAGGTILPGQVVYADPSANQRIRLAQANNALQAASVVGIALGSASPDQSVTYAISGDVTLPTSGANTQLMSGSVYVLSAGTAGGLIATAEAPAAGNFISLIGLGNGTVTATATNTLRLALMPIAAPKA